MRRSTPWLLGFLLGWAALPVTARDWRVDPAQSTLTFQGTYQNSPFTGRFNKFNAVIQYDEADLAHAKFDVTVDVGSLDTQSSERDDTLRTSEFFDVAHFPQAHFVTREFVHTADGRVQAKGLLTIRDQTKPVVLEVKFAERGDIATLEVDTVLNRLEFDLGAGKDWADIGREVRVHGHLVLSPK
jgi:polyisoprenoid-binding protein YceI